MIFLDTHLENPLYLQIYQQIKNEIMRGELKEYSKLPSTRTLAKTLSVSRNTVEYAYLQLCSEGYIKSKTGSGFIVEKLDTLAQIPAPPPKESFSEKPPQKQYKYNFQYGKLDAASFPLSVWRKLSHQCLSSMDVEDMMSYHERQGDLGLRQEIVKYVNSSRGVVCQPEQIVIGPGTQFCLTMLCQLLRPYSTSIAIEDPGYDGARAVFLNSGCKVIPVGLDHGSIDVDELEKTEAKIVYTTPSHQFPTGAVMPIQKRLRLIHWAIKNSALIIEDDYSSELRYKSRPIPAIHGTQTQDNVIYIGTFSKCLAPALRLSYMVLPAAWVEKYNTQFAKYNSAVPMHQQKTLQQFMSLGYWERHLRKFCMTYRKKHEILIKTIQQVMGNKVTIHGKNAGLHILLEIHNGLSEKDLIERAAAHEVFVYPVSRYWIRLDRYTDNMILLGFSEPSEAEIVAGINKLYHAWFES